MTIPDSPVPDANLPPGKRDAPGHPLWVLAYAHLDGTDQYVVLYDERACDSLCECKQLHDCNTSFGVAFGSSLHPGLHDTDCPLAHTPADLGLMSAYTGNDHAEALACWQ